MTSDVKITETASGKLRIESQGGDLVRYLHATEVAALRAHFVAERMPEDVRELLTLARNARDAHERPNGDGDWYLYRQAVACPGGPERVLAALEAAYPQTGAVDEPR